MVTPIVWLRNCRESNVTRTMPRQPRFALHERVSCEATTSTMERSPSRSVFGRTMRMTEWPIAGET